MKILMTAMSMGLGGAETHVLELSRELAAMGHDVTVASNGGAYAEKLRDFGVKHEKIPLHSKSPGAVRRAFSALSRLMERERFDIVHAHARIPAFICGKLRKKYGFAFVTTVHFDFCVDPILRKLSDWGEKTLAVSADLAESAAEKYSLPREKITVINNGIDILRFSPEVSAESVRKRFGLSGKRAVTYLGRLDCDSFLPAKILLDIAEDVFLVHPCVRFLIVGDGKKRAELCRMAKLVNEKCGKEIVFLPGSTEKAEEYFAACDVFVGPSRSALEALACGKPALLAGNFGMLGIFSPKTAPEALRTNFCCRGSAPITAERVKEELLRLLSLGKDEASALSRYGREFVEKHYSAEAMAKACLDEYNSLLEQRGKRAVICGYYGAGNIGDEAMLGALIACVKKSRNVKKITVISADAKKTAANFGVCAIYRGNLPAISRALAEADVLIFGGGNILQDKTSTRSLLYYAYLAHEAKKHACQVAFSANGIGPISRAKNLAAVKSALACADYISMRDEGSRTLAKALTGKENVFSSGELAFACESRTPISAKKKYFLVFPKHINGFDFEEMVRFCIYMRRRHGLLPVFVPMHLRQDEPLCKALALNVGGKAYFRACDARALRGLIHGAAFTVCMRFHAAVFSASEQVPAISVSDDGKLAAFFRGSASACLGASATASELAREALRALGEREKIKKLLGNFAEEQRRLALEELERIRLLFEKTR